MNNVLTFLLTVAILAASAVFAVHTRFKVIQDPQYGTLIIDNWDFATRKIIEKKPSGNWYAIDVIQGGQEVINFEEKMKTETQEDFRPTI
jgi:hypothetical protein